MDEEKGGVLKKTVDILYKIVELFSCLCLAGQIVIISYAVFTRYVLNSSPSWAEEISRVLMIWMSLLTVSLAVKDDSHVRISFLDKIFKGKALFIRDVFYALLNIAFSAVLFWKGLELAKQSARTKLPGSGLPSSVMYASVCVGGLLMVIMLVYKLGEQLCHKK